MSKSQFITIKPDEVKGIQTILQQKYSDTLVKAMSNEAIVDKLADIICVQEDFRNYPCFGNKDVSEAIIKEVAGLGVIDKLLQSNSNITDIGFNGRFLTLETNNEKYTYGNHANEEKIDEDYVVKLIQRFALREGSKGKSFTDGSPIFNGFSNNIRISATHQSLSPVGTTMSLRVSKAKLALNEDNFAKFAPQFVYDILCQLIISHANIIISGETGTGKTELQKLLIGQIPFEDKIIMIEDVAETHISEIYPQKDVYSWITSASKTTSGTTTGVTISDHVKNALRNNPKWLMISETRGPEAYEMFQAVLSGHNIITTLHSINNQAVPRRFVGMSSIGFDIQEDLLEEDFLTYMHIGIHIKKKIINGHVFRYLDELVEFVPKSNEHPNGINVLFEQRVDDKGNRIWKTYQPTEKICKLVNDEIDAKFSMPFTDIGEQKEEIPKVTELEKAKQVAEELNRTLNQNAIAD